MYTTFRNYLGALHMGKPLPAPVTKMVHPPDPSPNVPAVVPVVFSPFHYQSHVQSP